MHDLLASPAVLRRDLERLQDYVLDLRKHVMDIADLTRRDYRAGCRRRLRRPADQVRGGPADH